MAAAQDSTHISAATLGKSLRSGQVYGLMTPEGTPAPEDSRVEAGKARLLAGQTQSEELGVATQSKPPFEDESDSDSDSEGDNSRAPTQEQIEMTARVLACGKKEYRKILGLEENYTDPIKEKESKVNNFNKISALLHPDFNKTKGGEKAFKMVLRSGKGVGIEEDDIKAMKFWDGKEKIEILRLNNDGKWVPESEYMEVEKTSEGFNPSSFHQAGYKAATPFLGQLMVNPNDAGAINKLNEANARMFEQDKKDGLSDEECGKYAIIVSLFRSIFKRASDAVVALKENPADIDARKRFDLLNEELRQLNSKHHYPSEWTMVSPAGGSQGPGKEGDGKTASATTQDGLTAAQPRFRRTTRKPGYVLDNGVSKKIVACATAGFGHQLLLEHVGNNSLSIYELVGAATFGKGYGKSFMDQPGAKTLVLGSHLDLQGRSLDAISVAGVAAVRRDPTKEPTGGWAKEAKTVVLAGFGENPAENFRWYARSTLGKVFGQAAVDEELNAYRDEAGQERPLSPTGRVKKESNHNVEGAQA